MDATVKREDEAGNTAMLNAALGHDGGALLEAARRHGLRGHTIFATSGVSGRTKFVCLSGAALLASARAVNAFYKATSEDCWIGALPLFHVGGHAVPTRAALLGTPPILVPWREWSVERFLSECEANAVTLAPLVPTQLYDLVAARATAPTTLRAVIIGGAALDPGLRRKAEILGWPLRESYGMTEAASHVAAEPEREGTMVVLPHWEARVDEESRLWLRGPALFSGYLREAASGEWEFERPCDAEGWFPTEDRAELDGRDLSVLGRGPSVIKILGELVDVDAVERRYLAMSGWPGHSAVVAIPDERKGNALVLAFEPSLGRIDAEREVSAFNATAPGFERISVVVPVTAIPRAALGKVAREQLRALISQPIRENH